MQNIVDDKWCLLLQTMIDSCDNKTLLNKYDDDFNESDLKRNDNDDDKEDENVTKLVHFLQNDEFDQFNQSIDKYNKAKQKNIIKAVTFKLNSCTYASYYFVHWSCVAPTSPLFLVTTLHLLFVLLVFVFVLLATEFLPEILAFLYLVVYCPWLFLSLLDCLF